MDTPCSGKNGDSGAAARKISARKANLFLLQQLCNAPPFFNNISYCHILKRATYVYVFTVKLNAGKGI